MNAESVQSSDTPKSGLLGTYWSREELAREFKVTKRTISEWIARPDGLPYMKLGRNYFFRHDTVCAWLQKERAVAQSHAPAPWSAELIAMTRNRIAIRPQGEWLVREMAQKSGLDETEARAGLEQLIARGHVKVLRGQGPRGCDLFELVIKEPAP